MSRSGDDGATSWDQLEALWASAQALPEAERKAFLDAAVAGDARLRTELESFLSSAQNADAFFGRFAAVVDAAADALGRDESDEIDPRSGASSTESLPDTETDPLLGQTVGHYRIEARLGEGGMGVVYRALDTHLQRTVALKFLPAHLNADRRAKERFLIEARAAAALDHPNICSIHEVGETEGPRSFIAMAFYPGETLDRTLKNGPLPLDRALDYAMQIARGLEAAHERGIIHRDVKAANVVVSAQGVVKLLDFGIARMPDVTVSQTGVTPGTMAYMSPEQASGRPIDARTDLWSLGVLLYEMCTGGRPFRAKNPTALFHSILHDEPSPPSRTRGEVPRSIDAIIGRLLEKDPAARYGDAEELLTDLTSAQRSAPSVRGPTTRRSRRVIAAVAALSGFALLAVVLAVVLRQEAPAATPSIAVLPIASLSELPRDRWFADAMHDELIARLSTIQSIAVSARRSVMEYRDSDQSLPEIASELGVTFLVEGSAVQAGSEARINVSLYDSSGRLVWSRRFPGQVTNVFELQSEVAEGIAREIQARVTTDERNRFAGSAPVDTAAFNLYAEGRTYFDQGGPYMKVGLDSAQQLLSRAAGLFEQATRIDSTWALAWAYLAQARHWEASTSAPARADSLYRLSKEAAQRAIHHDPTQPLGYRALAYVLQNRDWDWEAAEKAIETARALEPNTADWHLATIYSIKGKHDDAIEAFERARIRDPASDVLRFAHGSELVCAGRYDEGVRLLEPVAGVSLGHWERFARARALVRQGSYHEAIADFDNLMRPGDPPPDVLAYAYAKIGNMRRAREIVEERERGRESSNADDQAWRLRVGTLADDLALGDTARLIRRLETMNKTKDQSLPEIQCAPFYADLIRIPSAREILGRMNLPL